MTLKDITDYETKIFECASSFRRDANYLMFELAKDNNFDFAEDFEFPERVYKHKYNSKGIFRGDWIYYFHGSECRFNNLNTGQVVELVYITKPEFGFLDGYFFYNYMLTTERYNNLAKWFEDYLNVWTAIDELADRGTLTRVPNMSTNRNIIAL